MNLEQTENFVGIDRAHCELIYGLIVSAKPRDVLELGWGTGSSSKTMLCGLSYNEQDYTYTLVDNWSDWSGRIPGEVLLTVHRDEIRHVDESEFLRSAADNSYDFILSDADHHRAHETVDEAWRILRSPGILIYHDVTNPDFPNLSSIALHFAANYVPITVFNKSSREDERCFRGLLVIFK